MRRNSLKILKILEKKKPRSFTYDQLYEKWEAFIRSDEALYFFKEDPLLSVKSGQLSDRLDKELREMWMKRIDSGEISIADHNRLIDTLITCKKDRGNLGIFRTGDE